MRWLRRLLGAVVILVVVVGLGLGFYARRVLPQTDGAITFSASSKVSGPYAELRIERDQNGIPTIKAAFFEDAVFGLGFVHAQDRLWQLETHRRIVSGRLAEAFGPSALGTDKFLRSLGVRRAAAAQWEQLGREGRAALSAYAAGINAFLRSGMGARPPEFVLLGLQPEEWDPIDTLGWGIMMAWDLSGNWSSEVLRMRLALSMPVERINELLPPYPGTAPLATADYAKLFRELRVDGALGKQALNFAPAANTEGVGSNNWVVHGSHTETGMPLLANDPHLKLSAPALWYFARMEAPGIKQAGASMPGLPFIVLGQNEHIAWGFTNTGPDVQDLYLERVKPDDPTQYQTPQGWAPFQTYEETISVKGRGAEKLTVRSTRHGPVISDGGDFADGLVGARKVSADAPSYVLAMRWTALETGLPQTGIEAGLEMGKARSVDEFIAGSALYIAPMQNMVVADRQGHIGVVSAGRVPLRKAENDLKGLVPAPGWDSRYDWDGYLDARLTPREVDPQRGFIATANQRIHPPEYPHYLSSEWAQPYRQQRIEQLLSARPKHSLDSLRDIQADVHSLAAGRLLPFLKAAPSTHALAAAAKQQLADFDGTMAQDKAAPLIFWAWVRHLTQLVLADEMGDALFERSLGSRGFRDALEGIMERRDPWWCDNKKTAAAESCEQQTGVALTQALDELTARYGSDVRAWQWGKAHVMRAEHRPLSHQALLARWFELRTPVGGDSNTVNVARVSLKPDGITGELYLSEHGPSLRALYDLADPARSRFMHSSGQSGIVFSPLYRNFLSSWARVEYVPLWSPDPPLHTLMLKPAQSSP